MSTKAINISITVMCPQFSDINYFTYINWLEQNHKEVIFILSIISPPKPDTFIVIPCHHFNIII